MSESLKFARLIARQKESGLTVKSFCSNEGIPQSTFYYWQKKIRNESGEKHFIPLVVNLHSRYLIRLRNRASTKAKSR